MTRGDLVAECKRRNKKFVSMIGKNYLHVYFAGIIGNLSDRLSDERARLDRLKHDEGIVTIWQLMNEFALQKVIY